MSTDAIDCLRTSFREVGKRYGYENVDAEFVAFKDFKISWERSYRRASFHVSDYAMDAPKSVMKCLAESIFSKMIGMEGRPYTEEMKDWALSEEFLTTKQPLYILRSKNLSGLSRGYVKDLEDSLLRLKKMGLIRNTMNPKLSWTKEMLNSETGYCSPLMNVIGISCYFDMEDVPDYVIDFVVYRQCLILEEGRQCFGMEPKRDYICTETRYPRYSEAMRWLARAHLK